MKKYQRRIAHPLRAPGYLSVIQTRKQTVIVASSSGFARNVFGRHGLAAKRTELVRRTGQPGWRANSMMAIIDTTGIFEKVVKFVQEI